VIPQRVRIAKSDRTFRKAPLGCGTGTFGRDPAVRPSCVTLSVAILALTKGKRNANLNHDQGDERAGAYHLHVRFDGARVREFVPLFVERHARTALAELAAWDEPPTPLTGSAS
jgi:hypothetical protein